MRRAVPYLVAVAILAAAVLLLPRGPARDEYEPVATEPTAVKPAPPARRVVPDIQRSEQVPEPVLLPAPTPQAVVIEGDLLVDDDGHFVAGPEARKFFDSVIAASRGEPPAAVRARIVAEINQRLPEDSASEAEVILDRYLAYRDRVREVEEDPPPDPFDRLRLVREIRLAELGDDVSDSLFTDVDSRDEYAALRYRIVNDPALSSDERDKALADLETKYPPEARTPVAEDGR